MSNGESGDRHGPCSWIVVAILVATLLLWRSPILADLRPRTGAGAPFGPFVVAWLPEALAIGIAGIALQRCLAGSAIPLSPVRTVLSWQATLAIWLVVWALAHLVPGWMVLGPLADDIAPLVDNFSLSSVAWLVNLVAVGIIILTYAPFALVSVVAGAFLAAGLLPAWRRLAVAGGTPGAGPGFRRRLGLVIATAVLFWLWRALAAAVFDPGTVRSMADAIVIALLLRSFVMRLGRERGEG